MHKFTYPPFPENGDFYIRLVRLHPGTFDDDLRITMRHELFGQNATSSTKETPPDAVHQPVYEAISYAWDKDLKPDRITVTYVNVNETVDQGSQIFKSETENHLGWLPLGINAITALRHFRFPDRPRDLWIDYLCIDQGDKVDKGQQVSMMGQIYARAAAVLIWLGEGADNSGLAMDSMAEIGAQELAERLANLRGFLYQSRRINLPNIRFNLGLAKYQDPRDRIYSVRALLPSKVQKHINPDYTLSTSEIYRAATIAYMQEMKDVDFLSQCRHITEEPWPLKWQIASGFLSTQYMEPISERLKYDRENDAILLNRITSECLGRQLIWTDDGFLGLGPLVARPGDQIWAVLGSRELLVMRPSYPQKTSPCLQEVTPDYEVGGGCSLCGYFEGEALLGLKPNNIQTLKHRAGAMFFENKISRERSLLDPRLSNLEVDLTNFIGKRNAKVYIAVRSESKARAAMDELMTLYPESKGELVYLQLDLADLASIKASALEFISRETRLDVLWNNAGVMLPPEGSKTVQGFELQLGVNVLGTLLFTLWLRPILAATAAKSPANSVRVVWVSSIAAKHVPKPPIDLSNLLHEKFDESQRTKYGRCKAGMILVAAEFGNRVANEDIVSISLEPGIAKTELQRNMPAAERLLVSVAGYEPIKGAYTELFAGLSPEINLQNQGQWVVPMGRVQPYRKDLLDETLRVKYYEWAESQIQSYMDV
ncbi:hypothetical protein E8E14_011226 [Neopestalotiopsis sp. 37M]|nr:hypothetical protein E8E14_011226 [Neopestalotiopsis sp. 37M]